MIQIIPETAVANATIFASQNWLSQNYDRYYLLSNGTLWVPVGIRKQLFWQWAQLTEAPMAHNGKEHSAEEEKQFLSEIMDYLRQDHVDLIRQPPTHVHFKAVPEGAKSCGFGSYRVDLTLSEEELWANVHQKHRNVIRKAEKDGVEIVFGAQYLPQCLELLRKTLLERSQVGMHAPEWFQSLCKNLPENVLCGLALYNGEPQGAVFMPFNAQGCYYLYGGSSDKPHGGAMNLLHWKAMLHMKSLGVLAYDFVGARLNPSPGSKYEGMQRFKERFGSKLHQGYLWKASLRPLRAFAYDFLFKLKNRHSLGDIIDQEGRAKVL